MTDLFWPVSLAALLLAIVVVLGVSAVLHWGYRRENGLVPYIFYQIVSIIILTALLSGRDLSAPLELHGESVPKHPLVSVFTNLTSLFFALAAVERIGRRLLHYGYKPDSPTMLILAYWVFFLSNTVTSALFGTDPSFAPKYVYWGLVGYAALLVSEKECDTAIRCARDALLVLLVLSALCIPLRPEMVVSTRGWMLLPGLDVRYVGLSTHANSLASEAIAFLLCLWHKPYSARWLNSLAWMLGCASLLLTQSKTNWISFVLCAFCMAYFRPEGYFRLWLSDFRRSLVPTGVLMIGMLTAGAIGIALMVSGIAGKMEATLADAQARSNLLTLVGRTQIWEVALDEWRNNPLFGYGLMIWKEEHRAQFSMHIVSAHNQFYESLAGAGIVGVAGLVIYAATLLWFVVKTTRASKGLSLALFLLLSIRSITEVTLSMEAFSAQMMHLLLLMVIASAIASSSSARVAGMVPANAGGRPFEKYGS